MQYIITFNLNILWSTLIEICRNFFRTLTESKLEAFLKNHLYFMEFSLFCFDSIHIVLFVNCLRNGSNFSAPNLIAYIIASLFFTFSNLIIKTKAKTWWHSSWRKDKYSCSGYLYSYYSIPTFLLLQQKCDQVLECQWV